MRKKTPNKSNVGKSNLPPSLSLNVVSSLNPQYSDSRKIRPCLIVCHVISKGRGMGQTQCSDSEKNALIDVCHAISKRRVISQTGSLVPFTDI